MGNDVFSEMMGELSEAFSTEAKCTIKYHRANRSKIIDTAWMGRTPFRVNEEVEGRAKIEWQERDYLIPVADLKIDGVLIKPQLGDWIEQIIPAVANPNTYKVSAPQGEQIWRYSDPQETVFRIHTKRFQF